MKTKNIVLLLTAILSFNIVSGIVVGQTGTGTVPPPGTILNQPVPSEIITASDKYIKDFVGDKYFSERLKPSANVTTQSGNEISYIVSYLYDMNLPEGYLISESPIHVAVTLDKDGSIKQYLGPKKPHTFAIKKDQVIKIAANNGMKEPDGGIDRVLALSTGAMDGYVWIVTGAIDETTCNIVGGSKECNVPGIYIDVDNGNIISKFNSSSLIQNPSPVTTTGVPVDLTPTETPKPTQTLPIQTPKSPFIGGLGTIIVLLIVVFIIRHKYKI